MDTILTEEKIESSIIGGVRILINLLGQKEYESSEAAENHGIYISNVVDNEQREKFALAIVPSLFKLNMLLRHPPNVN